MIFEIVFLVLVAIVTIDTIWIIKHMRYIRYISEHLYDLDKCIMRLSNERSKDADNVQ